MTTLTFFRSQGFIDWSLLDEHEQTITGEGPLRTESDENCEMAIYIGDEKIATLNTWQESPLGAKLDRFQHWELEGSGAKYDGVFVGAKVPVEA